MDNYRNRLYDRVSFFAADEPLRLLPRPRRALPTC